ncbi:MAG: hypothetical protein ABIL22_02345 [candidate division WOR-3 bacterium]
MIRGIVIGLLAEQPVWYKGKVIWKKNTKDLKIWKLGFVWDLVLGIWDLFLRGYNGPKD